MDRGVRLGGQLSWTVKWRVHGERLLADRRCRSFHAGGHTLLDKCTQRQKPSQACSRKYLRVSGKGERPDARVHKSQIHFLFLTLFFPSTPLHIHSKACRNAQLCLCKEGGGTQRCTSGFHVLSYKPLTHFDTQKTFTWHGANTKRLSTTVPL